MDVKDRQLISAYLTNEEGLSAAEVLDFFFVVDAAEKETPGVCTELFEALRAKAVVNKQREVLQAIADADPEKATIESVASLQRLAARAAEL